MRTTTVLALCFVLAHAIGIAVLCSECRAPPPAWIVAMERGVR